MAKNELAMPGLATFSGVSVNNLRKMSEWSCEPCPSKQPVTLPLDYVSRGERARGALAAVVVIAGIGAAFAAALCAKRN